MARALLATIGLVLTVLALCLMRYAPPPPVPRDAPPERFSAQRARDVQEKIVADNGASRMLGSEWNARARTILVDELKTAGFETVTEKSLACGRLGACAITENVIGKLEGNDPSLP